MTIPVYLEDGGNTGSKQHVTAEKAAFVTDAGCPPLLPQKCRVFREYLRSAAGALSMDVAGTADAPAEFFVAADADDDRYITAVNFYAGYGTTGELFEWFDSGAALANGCQLYYETQGDPVYIHDAMITNADILRLCVPGIMDPAWESRNFAATNDYGFICTVDLLRMMPPFGIKLDRGTLQRLVFAIRDDFTAVTDAFNAVCYGFDRFE